MVDLEDSTELELCPGNGRDHGTAIPEMNSDNTGIHTPFRTLNRSNVLLSARMSYPGPAISWFEKDIQEHRPRRRNRGLR
jgi:hypothetical protein